MKMVIFNWLTWEVIIADVLDMLIYALIITIAFYHRIIIIIINPSLSSYHHRVIDHHHLHQSLILLFILLIIYHRTSYFAMSSTGVTDETGRTLGKKPENQGMLPL